MMWKSFLDFAQFYFIDYNVIYFDCSDKTPLTHKTMA